MIKYLILAAGDISKSLQNEKDTNNANHRNMTTDDANEAEIGSTFTISPNPNHSSHSYSNHIGDQSTSTSIGIGTLKLILKSIEPPSNDLITAFEYNGTCCPPSHRSNPKNLIGSIQISVVESFYYMQTNAKSFILMPAQVVIASSLILSMMK